MTEKRRDRDSGFPQKALLRIEAEIDQAKSTCHLEFYIWHDGGQVERIVEALVRSRERGVVCRVLVDAIGSHRFLRSASARKLREAGVLIQDALPGGLLRMPFVRFDLRLHRKIVVLDGRVAYTGSLNMVDPRYFKRDAGVGQWVDAVVRIEGPAVEALQLVFLADWYVETSTSLDELKATGDAIPQPRRGSLSRVCRSAARLVMVYSLPTHSMGSGSHTISPAITATPQPRCSKEWHPRARAATRRP